MSRTASGYERKANELYETPEWVVDALGEVLPLRGRHIWEPACGPGKMCAALKARGSIVTGTDIVDYGSTHQSGLYDFTSDDPVPVGATHGIVTNPPYGHRNKMAVAFVEKGIARLRAGAFLALLLPVDFHCAKTRRRFFADCPHFTAKVVLTKRINWFEEGDSGNTENHAWFVWSVAAVPNLARPQIFYAPRSE